MSNQHEVVVHHGIAPLRKELFLGRLCVDEDIVCIPTPPRIERPAHSLRDNFHFDSVFSLEQREDMTKQARVPLEVVDATTIDFSCAKTDTPSARLIAR
jgi:hypothetical protein